MNSSSGGAVCFPAAFLLDHAVIDCLRISPDTNSINDFLKHSAILWRLRNK